MNHDEINKLIDRANYLLKDNNGFIQCRVESYSPVVLAYDFNDNLQAEQFITQQDLIISFRREISTNSLNTVLEYR